MGAEELFGVYRADRLNRETARFGLIGSPVDRSIGHLFHNRQLEELNGVYVKIDVKREEADGALAWLKELGFLGLSVTMPLKEWAAQQVEAWEGEDVGAVNTLWLGGGKVAGKNTDGEGALDALEAVVERVAGKRVWIFGSGGTARAVAYEARKRGAEVWIGSGRQAEAVAKLCGARVGRPDEWEVAINCTPASPAVEWKEGQVAMDVVYSPRETPFLTAAKEKGCQVVYGEEMFVRQAEKQLKWWREKWGRG
jgi:3-dehydroquinate dehydratase/shikimate dehydrogenase